MRPWSKLATNQRGATFIRFRGIGGGGKRTAIYVTAVSISSETRESSLTVVPSKCRRRAGCCVGDALELLTRGRQQSGTPDMETRIFYYFWVTAGKYRDSTSITSRSASSKYCPYYPSSYRRRCMMSLKMRQCRKIIPVKSVAMLCTGLLFKPGLSIPPPHPTPEGARNLVQAGQRAAPIKITMLGTPNRKELVLLYIYITTNKTNYIYTYIHTCIHTYVRTYIGAHLQMWPR